MKIYCLFECESFMLLGVFSSLEALEKGKEEALRYHNPWKLVVVERQLDTVER